MNKDPQVFLRHIFDSIKAVEKYSRNLTLKGFLENEEKQDAIIRRLEIIGEAVKNLPNDYKAKHPEVVWNKAMGIRNILIHLYFGVDLDIVWNTIKNDLPEFKKQIASLIDK